MVSFYNKKMHNRYMSNRCSISVGSGRFMVLFSFDGGDFCGCCVCGALKYMCCCGSDVLEWRISMVYSVDMFQLIMTMVFFPKKRRITNNV